MSWFHVFKECMQISRCLLWACGTATALLLPLATLHGQDNEAQSKARQALDQKLNELTPPAEPAPAPPAPPAPAPKATVPAAPQTPPPPPAKKHRPAKAASQSAAWPEYQDTTPAPQRKELEDALHEKMIELHQPPHPAAAQTEAPAPAPPAPVAAAPEATANPPAALMPPQAVAAQPAPPMAATEKAPEMVSSQGDGKYGHVMLPPEASPEQREKAFEALQQTQPGYQPNPSASTLSSTPGAKPAPSAPMASQAPPAPRSAPERPKAVKSSLPPLPTPPPAVSSSKEMQLQQLLQRYMDDQITPEQYHDQRAKILAQP